MNEGSTGKPTTSSASAARGDVTEEIIKELEFGMVQSLNFELGVHGAHRALYGLILDFQVRRILTQTLENPLSRDDLVAFAGAVQSFVQCARLTDAEFVYAPSHIALAACWMCEAKGATDTICGKDVVRKWIATKSGMGSKIYEAQRAEREKWREKKQDWDNTSKGASIQNEASSERPALAYLDYTAEEIKEDGLLISGTELEHILDAVASQIRTIAPETPPGTPIRPNVDMEQVKKIDLDLRTCLSLFETGQGSHGRKRPAEESDGNAKRQRTDATLDSDDDS